MVAFLTNIILWVIAFLLYKNTCFAQQNSTLRVVRHLQRPGICPAGELDTRRNSVKAEVRQLLENSVIRDPLPPPYMGRPCGCGGPGWTRVVHLNMTDTSQGCPPNLALTRSQVRGCHQTGSCSSAFFSVGRSYSQVCGRVNAYQYGTTDAFHVSITSSYRCTIE